VDTVRQLGTELGFDVDVVEPIPLAGSPISSSRIRKALQDGDVVTAAAGLGRAYSVTGRVVRGDGRGRALGFPTANIEISDTDKLLPQEGIYAVRGLVAGLPEAGPGTGRPGVLHLGPRPTFPGAAPSVELHLLDFDAGQDLYGRTVRVDFCARIRGIERYGSAQELIQAMRTDCGAAQEIFARGRGAC
jgi:riboflavin kinase / FMN adenylyltransferase